MGGGLKSTYRSWRPSCDYMQVAQEAVTMVGVRSVGVARTRKKLDKRHWPANRRCTSMNARRRRRRRRREIPWGLPRAMSALFPVPGFCLYGADGLLLGKEVNHGANYCELRVD